MNSRANKTMMITRRRLLLSGSLLLTILLLFATAALVAASYACSPPKSGGTCDSTTHQCLTNPNHAQKSTDEHCAACLKGQTYWPCDVDGLCYCWDITTPKIPPAPSTKLPQSGTLDPCDTIITQSIFDALAPDARHPYSYRGFCQAIRDYNTNHPSEGIFIMGTELQQRHELAAFFGNVLHESDELKAGREYLMCADQIEHNGEIYCKPCDMSGFDWTTFKCTGASLASEGRAFNGYCQSNLLPPDGCECDDVYEVASVGPLAGYVKADEVYFGRGAIQLSWNYNYIKASVALTGAPQTFCQRPDLVATKEEYAWGAGMFFWMENVKNDMTCHQAVLMNDEFGQTLDIINGGLECPADDHGWHGKAVQLRLNRYCRAATALGLDTLLSLDGCMDMTRKFNQCLEEGNCEACRVWEGKIQASSSSSAASANNNNVPTKKPRRTKRPTRPPNPVRPPTPQPTVEPKSAVVEMEEVVEVAEELNKVRGPCIGEPCPVPPGVEGEFCRSNDGICGTGSPYCNAESTWTSFCFDCESDSPHGCPTFGCSDDCSGETQQCVGNKNGINPISDEECEPCGQGQTYYPCDVVGSKGCWCWDTRLPRVEPAPPSGLKVEESTISSEMTTSYGEGVCGVLIDKSLFRLLAPNAQHPFTYEGFCSAIDHYNSRHAEKVFRMGSEGQRLDELIAFLGMVSHETDGFIAPREYLACGDNILVDGELFCMPCTSDDYNFDTHTCGVSMMENDQTYMEFCQPYTTPPKGCNCEYVKEVEVSGQLEGHMKANDIFFGRGSIHISNNFNYIRASATMTGSEDTFCEEPELLATDETYSWGVGLYIWMEFMKEEGHTSHTHALNGRFGSSLDIINGAIECPAEGDDEWSSKAVRRRLDHYCNVAQVFGAINLLSMDGCMGLHGVFTQCMMDGSCPNCAYYDPKIVRTASPTRKPSTPVIATPPPTSAPKTAPPSTTPASRTPPPTDTISAVTSPPRTRRPTSKPTEAEPVPIRTFKPTLSPEEVSEDLGTMTNWAMTELKYPPTSTPSANPTFLSTIKPTPLLTPQPTRRNNSPNKPDSDAGKPPDDTMETEIVPASAPANQQSDEEESLSSLMTQVDENTFIFTPLADTTISRTNPDTNYGLQPTMVVNMIDGDVALISFDLSGLEDAVIDKAVLRLAILDENTQNAGIFYIQPTINGWTEDTVTYNSAPRAGGPLFASTVDQQDRDHLELDVTNGVGNHVVSFKIIGTDKMRSEFGSKESSNESNVPALVVEIASQFTSSRPINDSDSGKENPYDLGTLYQGKPSVVQVSGGSSNSPSGRISGHIWLDTNRDSVKEADEPGLRGILVDLYSCDDRWITGTRSSSGGDYIFDELSGGNYYVIVTLSADNEFALKNVGPDDSKDSDVDAITGRSDCIELSLPLELSASVDVGIAEVDLDSQINESSAEEEEAGAVDYNCRGKPCTEGNGTWCRSEHNYCGTGETYCNQKSQWTPDCPSLAPTLEPTLKPTTGQPTFVHDEDINCSGEPCTEEGDGTWCRSEIGFCGSGPFYCNSDSTWLPKCYGDDGPVDGNTQTLAEVLDSFNSVGEDSNAMANPTKAPTKSEMAEFSSFSLPTLTHISNPKQVDTTALGNMYGIETTNYESSVQSDTPPGTESQNVFTIDHDSFGMQSPDFYAESSWFAGLGSPDSTPENSSYSSLVTVWRRRSQFFLYLYVVYILI